MSDDRDEAEALSFAAIEDVLNTIRHNIDLEDMPDEQKLVYVEKLLAEGVKLKQVYSGRYPVIIKP